MSSTTRRKILKAVGGSGIALGAYAGNVGASSIEWKSAGPKRFLKLIRYLNFPESKFDGHIDQVNSTIHSDGIIHLPWRSQEEIQTLKSNEDIVFNAGISSLPFEIELTSSKFVVSRITDYLAPQNELEAAEIVNNPGVAVRAQGSDILEVTFGGQTRKLDETGRYNMTLDLRSIKGPNGKNHTVVPTVVMDLFTDIELKYNGRDKNG